MKMLIGGSPCTHWSIAQTKNRETEASGIGWGRVLDYIGVGWEDDLFDDTAPKQLCEDCVARLGKDFTMEQPAEACNEKPEKGTCWSCGRKRCVSKYYATEEEPAK